MATKFGRKEFPPGYSPTDFTYRGRPGAQPEGDYLAEDKVSPVDMACVNPFTDAVKTTVNNKYFHGGVVQSSDGAWWCYFEWGRISHNNKSWNGSFAGGDFQFVRCSGEDEARSEFAKKIKSKNTSRLTSNKIAGVTVWASKTDKHGKSKDGYIIQPLATRIRGLPDAYTIKDGTGVSVTASDATPKPKKPKARVTKSFHPEVLRLTKDLVGGVQTFTQRASAEAGGIVPTLSAIEQVRNDFIPAAMQQIARIGTDVDKQIRDPKLIDISKLVAALVPRPIPRSGTPEERAKAVILSAGNILSIQNDLDAFEAALNNEDFSVDDAPDTVDPDSVLNAKIDWVDPNSEIGRWVAQTYGGMTRNRHTYMGSHPARIKGIFSVSRPRVDTKFLAAVKAVAGSRRSHRHSTFANGQPRRRPDCADISDFAAQANVFLGIHGTRPVNVAPIIQSDLRLPRQLKGVHITGAAFGHGIYWATDWRKSYGYTGHTSGGRGAYYGSGGQIQGRGFFMFLCDVIMGKPYICPSTGSWGSPPDRSDSVFAAPRDRGGQCSSLSNDEHITFNANYHRIRYIIEAEV